LRQLFGVALEIWVPGLADLGGKGLGGLPSHGRSRLNGGCEGNLD